MMTDNDVTGDLSSLPALPPDFAVTRESLHLVAARVLGAARYAAVGRLGLVVVPGGFGTPDFDGRRLLVVDAMLSDGRHRQPMTKLSEAYSFAGIDPTAPLHPVLDIPADPETPLVVDADAASILTRWFALGQSLLESVLSQAGPRDEPSAMQLWPEHFDLALDMGIPGARANYGASPGDGTIGEPYLYVGPHDHREGSFWNAPFGAALTYDEIRGGADPVAFYRRGRELLLRP
jgi:hypothetical protein